MLERLVLALQTQLRQHAGNVLKQAIQDAATSGTVKVVATDVATHGCKRGFSTMPTLPSRSAFTSSTHRNTMHQKTFKRWQTQPTNASQPPQQPPVTSSTTTSAAALTALRAAARGACYAGKATAAVARTAMQSSIGKAMTMHLEAFWRRHSKSTTLAGGLLLVYVIWRVSYNIAAIFIDVSDGLHELGFLAGTVAAVVLAAAYIRRRYTIDPETVYRLAMLRLNTNPGVLEVMGAPLQGSPLRALVVTGGEMHLKGLRPKVRSSKLQMMFPLEGPARQGLVSLEATKRSGQYHINLLAVDVAAPGAASEERYFLAGDEMRYQHDKVLAELRGPFLKALEGQQQQQQQQQEEVEEVDLIRDVVRFDGSRVKGVVKRLLPRPAAAPGAAGEPAAPPPPMVPMVTAAPAAAAAAAAAAPKVSASPDITTSTPASSSSSSEPAAAAAPPTTTVEVEPQAPAVPSSSSSSSSSSSKSGLGALLWGPGDKK